MNFDRGLGNLEPASDNLVGVTTQQASQDFALPRRKIVLQFLAALQLRKFQQLWAIA